MSRWPPPPSLGRAFYKAHGLGNDYLVFEEGVDWAATPDALALVCDHHRGVGSDGIVALLSDRTGGVFHLRMFNPDGSEFERSGNGLRVLGSYLMRRGERPPFTVSVAEARLPVDVRSRSPVGYDIAVEMGQAEIGPDAIELDREALDEEGRLAGPDGRQLEVVAVRVGNPHIVVVTDDVTETRLARLGPYLTSHPGLRHGANVQLAATSSPGRCRTLIWERGVGPTSASGTSACAVAVAMTVSGRAPPGDVAVEMPGGELSVKVSESLDVVLRGRVEEVCEGALTDRFLAALSALEY
jgi:diaminopimelate epimerase